MRLSDDPLPHTLVQGPADYRREQRIRVGFRQPSEPQLRQPGQLVELTRPTLREHEDDRLRLQAPRHEREHLRGRLIEPLRIVDQAEKRLFVGTVRQQTQQGEADEKTIRPGARAQAKSGRERLTLGRRQPPQAAEQRRTQLVKARKGKLHLGLHPDRVKNPAAFGMTADVFQKRCLPDPRLAAQYQHRAPPRMHGLQEPIKLPAFGTPAPQHRSTRSEQARNHLRPG